MNTVYLLSTGGTISMQQDAETGTVNPAANAALPENLAPYLERLNNDLNLVQESVVNLPSPHLTPAILLQLMNRVQELANQPEAMGIVITHGTDTLEETADLLDITLDTQKPVVLTGALRSANEVSADGPGNVLAALLTAAAASSVNRGCLVVLNNEIHAARHVTKTHSSNLAAFQSPGIGPIGLVSNHAVSYRSHLTVKRRKPIPVKHLPDKVALVKMASAMDGCLLDCCLSQGFKGVVLEALGMGNVPSAVVPSITRLIRAGLPVIMVSRCYEGNVQPVYGYTGGGKQLQAL
ncbi:MAG: L-asparaginase, partial [Bacilli bacterium]|nr:L-asparaginase [Bacilli bacterium]